MSHEITSVDCQEGRTMAWHGLTTINENLTLENCHLNPNRPQVEGDTKPRWDYQIKEIEFEGKKTGRAMLGVTDGATIKNEDTGEENVLTIGDSFTIGGFKPLLNARGIEILAPHVESNGLVLESCGTVKARGRQFWSFSLDALKFQAANRPFQGFFNIGNGNDKSSPIWVNTSNICTVCNNTFTFNMDFAGFIMQVKKTKFSEAKIENLGRAIEAILKGQADFAKKLNDLAGISCDDTKALEFFAGFLAGNPDNALSTRSQTALERLLQLFKGGAGNDGNDFSDVFQAATDYFTHEAANSNGGQAANWKNHVSSEFGAGRIAKQEIWAALETEKSRKGFIMMGKKVLKATADKARNEGAAK